MEKTFKILLFRGELGCGVFTPMKTYRTPFMAAALAAVLISGVAPSFLLAAGPKEDVVIDFTDIHKEIEVGQEPKIVRAYEFVYDTWNKHVMDLPKRGALIQAPTGKGGLGENKTAASFKNFKALEVEFVIGNANQTQAINFALVDTDGTEQSWTIQTTGKPTGLPIRQHIDLAKCDNEAKPGSKPGLNLKKIDSWQIRGNWQDPKVEILLIKVVGVK